MLTRQLSLALSFPSSAQVSPQSAEPSALEGLHKRSRVKISITNTYYCI